MAPRMPRWWRSPLFHFLVIGGVLFAVERIVSGPPARTSSGPLVIDAARIRQLRDDYQRATTLAPTDHIVDVTVSAGSWASTFTRQWVVAGRTLRPVRPNE
jgi:hypothetical protein